MSLSEEFDDLPPTLSHLQVAGLAFDALTSQPRLLSLDCAGPGDQKGDKVCVSRSHK